MSKKKSRVLSLITVRNALSEKEYIRGQFLCVPIKDREFLVSLIDEVLKDDGVTAIMSDSKVES